MQQWLELYLKDKYKIADEIIVVDAHSERLDRVLRKYDIVQEEAIGVDIQIDVLGIVKKAGKFKLFFIEAKKTSLTLRDLGQLWAYCKLIDPEEAFLLTSADLGSLNKILNIYKREDLLDFGDGKRIKKMKIAVMGYGTIGSGVVEVLEINKEKIAKRAGEPIEVKYVLDLREFPGTPIENKIVHDYKVIAEDPEIGIVVETMGGVEPAFTFVKAMLEAGKQVATSNKNLVAAKGAELIKVARDHGVNFQFEASVGGGIPIIRPLNKCLTADEIEEITGILNGTTNYMLTKMTEEGADFDEVLKDAQDKGYAEKDPTADIEGYDPCRKIAILTSLVAGQQVDFEDIHCEGITKITPEDIKYAKAMHRAIKLLASSRKVGDSYTCLVAPYMIDDTHPLSGVNGVFNGVFLRGNVLGDAMFYGSGAGKLPTASAVVADVVDMTKHQNTNIYIDWKPEKLTLVSYDDSVNSFFVRTDSPKSEVEAVFGHVDYIENVVDGEYAFTTGDMTEKDFADKASKVNVINRIRL